MLKFICDWFGRLGLAIVASCSGTPWCYRDRATPRSGYWWRCINTTNGQGSTNVFLLCLATYFSVNAESFFGQNHGVTHFSHSTYTLTAENNYHEQKLGKVNCALYLSEENVYRSLEVYLNIVLTVQTLPCKITYYRLHSHFNVFLKQAVNSCNKFNRHQCWVQICGRWGRCKLTKLTNHLLLWLRDCGVVQLSKRSQVEFLTTVTSFQYGEMQACLFIGI